MVHHLNVYIFNWIRTDKVESICPDTQYKKYHWLQLLTGNVVTVRKRPTLGQRQPPLAQVTKTK